MKLNQELVDKLSRGEIAIYNPVIGENAEKISVVLIAAKLMSEHTTVRGIYHYYTKGTGNYIAEDFPFPGIGSINIEAFFEKEEKVLTAEDLVIGEKYVPVSKSAGYKDFNNSRHWNVLGGKDQGYLYYVGFTLGGHKFSYNMDRHNGDYYLPSDMKLYKPDNMSKTFPLTLKSQDAQRIINTACSGWKPKLASKWGAQIVQDMHILVNETEYQEMRKACTPQQHLLFDKIFGKDVEHPKDGTPCLVTGRIKEGWKLRYANGKGEFYTFGAKSGESA